MIEIRHKDSNGDVHSFSSSDDTRILSWMERWAASQDGICDFRLVLHNNGSVSDERE